MFMSNHLPQIWAIIGDLSIHLLEQAVYIARSTIKLSKSLLTSWSLNILLILIPKVLNSFVYYFIQL